MKHTHHLKNIIIQAATNILGLIRKKFGRACSKMNVSKQRNGKNGSYRTILDNTLKDRGHAQRPIINFIEPHRHIEVID